MSEAKKVICYKCGESFYEHEHHILSQTNFGIKGKTIKLCPNCHAPFHEYSKKETKNLRDKEEPMLIWKTWGKTVALAISIWILITILIWIW